MNKENNPDFKELSATYHIEGESNNIFDNIGNLNTQDIDELESSLNQDKKKTYKNKSLIRLPDSGLCPLCGVFSTRSNFLRHLQRNHQDFVFNDNLSLVTKQNVYLFVGQCMANSCGLDGYHANILADVLKFADSYGFFSEGLRKINTYMDDLKSGKIVKSGTPTLVSENSSIVYVDGQNMLGCVVAQFCTSKAIELAKIYGVGYVLARRSNDIGPGQYYTQMMNDAGMIGIVYSTDSRLNISLMDLIFEITSPIDNHIRLLLSIFCEALTNVNVQNSDQYFFAATPNNFPQNFKDIVRSNLSKFGLENLEYDSKLRKNAYDEKNNNIGGICYPNEVLQVMDQFAQIFKFVPIIKDKFKFGGNFDPSNA